MKKLVLLMILWMTGSVLAETLPLTIWQKETRWQPVEGQVVDMHRGPFTMVLPLAPGENAGVLVAEGEAPEPMEGFEPGHGMAGPYDGLYLTWQGFHYFHVDDDMPRAELWDREKKQYFWKAGKLFRNYGLGPAEEISWDEVEDLTVIVKKDGFDDLTFYVNWVDY